MFVGKVEHILGGALVAHEEDVHDVRHLRGSDRLVVRKAGDQQDVIGEQGEHIAHEVGCESETDLTVEIAMPAEYRSIHNPYDIAQFHASSSLAGSIPRTFRSVSNYLWKV